MRRFCPSLFRVSRRARVTVLAASALFLHRGSAAAEPGFVPLFNGHDLSQWEGDPALWSVQDGVIVGQRVKAERADKGNTFLIWKGGAVRNFELRASIRLLSENSTGWANSGIQYRSRVVDPARWVVRGYQADMDTSGKYVGQIYEEGYRGFLALPGQSVRITDGGAKPHLELVGATADPAAIRASVHLRGWNEYVVIAEGHHLRQYFNGIFSAEAVDLDAPHAADAGVLALQLHAGLPMRVEFKDLRLKTLP